VSTKTRRRPLQWGGFDLLVIAATKRRGEKGGFVKGKLHDRSKDEKKVVISALSDVQEKKRGEFWCQRGKESPQD